MNPTVFSNEEVGSTVRRYLDQHQSRDYRLEVVPEGIRLDDEWWYVAVRPSREDIRSSEYTLRLVEIEQQIRENGRLKILLVPVLFED